MSLTLPLVTGNFDDVFEIPLGVLTANPQQIFITVDVVEPGVAPIRMTGNDDVTLEKVFQDAVPWIVVSLVKVRGNL